MGQTPIRHVRIPDETWQAAARIAAARGETLADVIRAGLERYARRHRTLDQDQPDK